MNQRLLVCIFLIATGIIILILLKKYNKFQSSKNMIKYKYDRHKAYLEYIDLMKINIINYPRNFHFTGSNVPINKVEEFLYAAKLSLLAYETDINSIKKGCIELGCRYVGSFNVGSCWGFIAIDTLINPGTQIIGIQGTEFVSKDRNLWEVWADLSIEPEFLEPRRPGYEDIMYVHSGMYDCMASCMSQIVNMLNINEYIWIVGHSLGGVRSMLMRYLLPDSTFVRITNFGAPRGANYGFWNYFDSENTIIERVIAERDFAPDFQPLLPYEQPNSYFYWLTQGTIQFTNERNWLNLSFDDHSIQNSYIPLLNNIVITKGCDITRPAL